MITRTAPDRPSSAPLWIANPLPPLPVYGISAELEGELEVFWMEVSKAGRSKYDLMSRAALTDLTTILDSLAEAINYLDD